MGDDSNPTIVGVTVTYGDRVEYVAECIESMYAAGANSVVLVTNGVSQDVRERLAAEASRAARDGRRAELLHLDQNYGPGVGFGVALEAAIEQSPDWVLLLDDDNAIQTAGVGALSRWLGDADSRGSRLALCHRPIEKWQTDSIRFGADANPGPGSFLYFDLLTRVAQRFGIRSDRRESISEADSSRITMSMAPFGGLVLSRFALDTVAPPRRDMTLYEEDSEYVDRLLATGFSIELLDDVLVDDLDDRWSSGTRRLGILDAVDLLRLWVSLRNRVAIDRIRADRTHRRPRLLANAAVYLLLTTAAATVRGRWSQLSTVYSAIRAGWRSDPFRTQPPKRIDVDSLALKVPTNVQIKREAFDNNSLGTE